LNLSSPLNDIEFMEAVAHYDNTAEVDLSSESSVEFAFLLNDLGLTINDYIDVTFWHFDTLMAGEMMVLLHSRADTIFRVALRSSPSSTTSVSDSDVSASLTDNTQSSDPSKIPGFNLIIILATLVLFGLKLIKNKFR
ncbi:MAG: hypothetical protein ACFFCQ_16805, partial [Promethearchaeota archaeon]